MMHAALGLIKKCKALCVIWNLQKAKRLYVISLYIASKRLSNQRFLDQKWKYLEALPQTCICQIGKVFYLLKVDNTDAFLFSDIDMVVQGSGVNLKLIARRLERAGIADNMQMILHAQVGLCGRTVHTLGICNHDILFI